MSIQIDFEQVSKSFGPTKALDQVSCSIPPGTIAAVIGLNGAGKTTMLQLLAGILRPNKGDVLLEGQPFDRDNMDLRRRLCFFPDFIPTLGHFTPLRHATMVFQVYEKPFEEVRERLLDIYDRFNLLSVVNAPIVTLSRGQYYKAMLAPMMCVQPDLWLVDEPFASGMDPEGMAFFREVLQEQVKAGSTLLFSTQIIEVVQGFADVMLVLHEGRLVEQVQVKEWTESGAGFREEVNTLLKRLREHGEDQ